MQEIDMTVLARTRFAVVRQTEKGPLMDTDDLEFTPALALDAGLRCNKKYPRWGRNNPIIGLVEVEVTPTKSIDLTEAGKDLDELNAEMEIEKQKQREYKDGGR